MTKTFYVVMHVNMPEEEIIDKIIDSDLNIPLHKDLDSAQIELEEILSQGLEFTIQAISITVR